MSNIQAKVTKSIMWGKGLEVTSLGNSEYSTYKKGTLWHSFIQVLYNAPSLQ